MRHLLVAVAALVLTLADARSAEFTRILVGFPPGQATDLVARLLSERLGPLLGETVIVENRPGQGGSIALASLLQSAANGHTLVLAPLASLVVNPCICTNPWVTTPSRTLRRWRWSPICRCCWSSIRRCRSKPCQN